MHQVAILDNGQLYTSAYKFELAQYNCLHMFQDPKVHNNNYNNNNIA